MNGRLAVQERKNGTVLPASRFLQHTAVQPIADHAVQSEPAGAVTESRFGQDFSQVAVHSESGAPRSDFAPPCRATPTRCPFGGACHTCPVRVQAKMAINQPGDEYEQEADRVANQLTGSGGVALQRRAASQEAPTHVPPIVHEVLRWPGQPLDAATRAFMEPRFANDFSRVRVHTDARAAESARAVNALVYTVGDHLIFGAGQYAPETARGGWLLAHELTHVVQQGTGGRSDPQYAKAVSQPSDAAEVEAEATAERVMRGDPVQVTQPASVVVQGISIGEGIGIGLGVAGAVGLGLGIAALAGAFRGSKVSVDASCKNFCPSLDIEQKANEADRKAASPIAVKFTYQVTGAATTSIFDQKISFNSVVIKCDTSNTDCGGWSSKGVITLGKKACISASCGDLASTILHEMVHDWAGWGPPYDKQNVTVPGATHAAPDYLDEWIARYVEKTAFAYNPWGLP